MTSGHVPFNVMIVGQSGRLAFEAALFALSLRQSDPEFSGRLWVAEPEPGPLWPEDPRIADTDIRVLLTDLGATIVPFASRHFGAAYPQGNKIEALFALPRGEPFVFFDTDTLITGPLGEVPFDWTQPTASLRREGTWPRPQPGGPGLAEIWEALYGRFGLDIGPTLDLTRPTVDWRRYLYFNAGFYFYDCPHVFGSRFIEYALSVRNEPPPELAGQSLNPWLDQAVLPLVIHALGGGRETLPPGLLDGTVSCHWRVLPLLYARESDNVVALMERLCRAHAALFRRHPPIREMVFEGRGAEVRALFDRDALPADEATIRRRIRQAGLWMR